MSKKDAYYFPHDSNAKDDPKCVMLIEQLGLEGYGIFWVLVETLRDQKDYKYPIALLPAIARRYNTSLQKVEAVVKAYSLFDCDENSFFFSKSLINRMLPMELKRLQASEAGKKSARKRKELQQPLNETSTTVERPLNECTNDRSTIKEDKIKEENKKADEIKKDNTTLSSVVKNNKFIKPTLDDVKFFFTEKNCKDIEAEKYFNYYESNGWMVGKNKMKNWQASANYWISNIKSTKQEYQRELFEFEKEAKGKYDGL